MRFFPVKWVRAYLALSNSLRLVQLNWTCTSKPKQIAIEMCVHKVKSEAGWCQLMGVFQKIWGSIRTSSLMSAQKKNCSNHHKYMCGWTFFNRCGQCFSGSGNIPQGKCVTVQNLFTPQKSCQEQACASSLSPRAGTVAVPRCMDRGAHAEESLLHNGWGQEGHIHQLNCNWC